MLSMPSRPLRKAGSRGLSVGQACNGTEWLGPIHPLAGSPGARKAAMLLVLLRVALCLLDGHPRLPRR